MSTDTFRIESHWVGVGATVSATAEGIPFAARAFIAGAGEGYRLVMWLLSDEVVPPNPVYNAVSQEGTLFLPFSDFPLFLDLVRNVSPLYGWVNDEHPERNCLKTTPEQVAGEEM